MQIRDVQRLLAVAKYYDGAIDGLSGPETNLAVRRIIGRNEDALVSSPTTWPEKRLMVAAGQLVLDAMGYETGPIDGYYGPSTANALREWDHTVSYSEPAPRRSRAMPTTVKEQSGKWAWPKQSGSAGFYGTAGNPSCTAGKCALPIPFLIAWNTGQRITSFSCHEKIEKPLALIFNEALKAYGEAEFKRLRLHYFGGCFNNRNKRGGATKSMHAYGAAVDLDPMNNQFHVRAPKATFSRAEYDMFWNIVESTGAVSGGRAWGYDWMHFQFAR